MGTVILLAACLLVASANPMANYNVHSTEHGPDTPSEHGSSSDGNLELSTGDNTGNDAREPSTFTDDVSPSTENTEDSDNGNMGHTNSDNVDPSNEDADNGNGYTLAASTVSTTSTTVPTEDNPNDTTDNEATSMNETASTNPAKPTPDDSEKELHKGDDPDCSVTNNTNHTYVSCQFKCQVDEMELAPDNSSCYLNRTQTMLASPGARSLMETMETGICKDGDCVPRPTEPPAGVQTTEPSTSFSTEASLSTSTTTTSTTTSTAAAITNDSQNTNALEHVPIA